MIYDGSSTDPVFFQGMDLLKFLALFPVILWHELRKKINSQLFIYPPFLPANIEKL